MRKTNIRYILTTAFLTLAVFGCKDKMFDNYSIQSVDNHGKDENIVSTAVTAATSDEFLAVSVDATDDVQEVTIGRFVLTAKEPAKEDIHITVVPALDTLASYNAANKTAYKMPVGDGSDGSPTFTVSAEAMIPKGSVEGFLKIKLVSNNYFSDDGWAFAYRIESVKESGYTISGNNNFFITAVVPKNDYDGVYAVGPGGIQRFTGGALNPPAPADPLHGIFTSLKDAPLVSTAKYALSFAPLWADNKTPVAGIDGTQITVGQTPIPDGPYAGFLPVTMTCKTNATLENMADSVNYYDPATKKFHVSFHWGVPTPGNERKYWTDLVYKSVR